MLASFKKSWKVIEADPGLVAEITAANDVLPVVARLLVNRGINRSEDAAVFLNPDISQLHDPMTLKDMDAAVDKLCAALEKGTSIAIYGDYDVDGITATAILMEFLSCLTTKLHYFIPERLNDGYGLNRDTLSVLKRFGAELIITVDCGISNNADIQFGKEIGLDFIVTDHHHPSSQLPQGVPVVNPQREDCAYLNKFLAGAGVAFKLIQGIKASMSNETGVLADKINAFDLNRVMEMVAIGSIGDVVPLTGENRVLANLGLKALEKTQIPGLVALKKISGITYDMSSSSVSFYLAPRLNTSGRLGRANRGVQLFLEKDPEKAQKISEELDRENKFRQKLERDILEECKQLIKPDDLDQKGALVLAADHWHPGVIGIVASRLVDLFHRPAVLLAGTGKTMKGSIRSVPECPLPEILSACSNYLISYGGHKFAAGFEIARPFIKRFRKKFNMLAFELIKNGSVTSDLNIDLEIDLREIKPSLMRAIDKMEPFGNENPPPLFLSRGVMVTREPEVFGNNHLKLALDAGGGKEIGGIGFKMGDLSPSLWCNAPVDIVYTPSFKRHGGKRDLYLNIKDISTNYMIEYGDDHENKDSP